MLKLLQLISNGMSSKILKEAIIQQREIQDEVEAQNPSNVVFTQAAMKPVEFEDEEDVDDFDGFLETQSQYDGYDVSFVQTLYTFS